MTVNAGIGEWDQYWCKTIPDLLELVLFSDHQLGFITQMPKWTIEIAETGKRRGFSAQHQND